MAVANILLWCDSIYLFCCADVPSSWWVGRSAVITALCIAILFCPIEEEKSWTYSYRTVRALCFAVIFSVLFIVCWGIVTLTVQTLFGIYQLGYNVLWSFEVPGALSLPFMLFLSLLPNVRQIDSSTTFGRLGSGTTKFFILPLTAIYFLVLYIYLVKIIGEWSLPTDSVSWPVAIQVAAVMILLWGLKGERRKDPTSWIALRLPRFLILLMFPLLVLASIAIIYRVREYGWTAPRLYVAAFNVWCYGAFLYLLLSGRKRLNKVAFSFAIIFVGVSIIPYANLVYLGSRLERKDSTEKTVPQVSAEIKLSDKSRVAVPEGFGNVNTFRVSSYANDSKPVKVSSGCLDIFVEGTSVTIRIDSLIHSEKAGLAPHGFSLVSSTGDSIIYLRELS
ncbi:MAG: DUF4153 domain-containing protein, partial [Duncaniella sp.]|nr:DUF4153 domain-containing protein [Duncaniella sp.]